MWRTGSGNSRELEPLDFELQRDIGLCFLRIGLHTASQFLKRQWALNHHGGRGEEQYGSSDSWIPRGLWTLVPNSWIVGGLHLEGTGCVTELETLAFLGE